VRFKVKGSMWRNGLDIRKVVEGPPDPYLLYKSAAAAIVQAPCRQAELMMKNAIRRILVPIDPSRPRDAAFEQARSLARDWNAELYLLHIRPARPVSRFTVAGEDLELQAGDIERSQLAMLVRSAQDDGVEARVVSARGANRTRAIVAHAELLMADLIVVPRDLASPRLWRVPREAGTIGRSAGVPVLIVPSQNGKREPGSATFNKVVVAVDFTVASAVALRVATDLIVQGNGHGTAVHALPYPSPMVFSGSEAFLVIDDLRSRVAQAEARLRDAIPASASRFVKPRVVAGAAGQAIVDVAADVDADLVVMGVPDRNRLGELVFGSTFRRVVRRSLRPILAVPVAAGGYRWAGEPPAHVVTGGHQRAA
jgi:nucleotide-binding universal stress UspA family protein